MKTIHKILKEFHSAVTTKCFQWLTAWKQEEAVWGGGCRRLYLTYHIIICHSQFGLCEATYACDDIT